MKLTGLTPTEIMEIIDVTLCLPLVLLMNFALFQYLFTTFFRRRREPLVSLLLVIAFLSFASLIPFGFPDPELARTLNDISETCSVLTFLIQICILTRDINRKMKLKALAPMLRISEVLIFVGLAVLVCNLVDIAAPVIDMDVLEHLDEALEGVSLVFIVAFRFYFLARAKGLKAVWRAQKLEILFYVLFLTHEYPFMALTHLTGLSWEHVQGVWMRITIVMCLWMTVKARLSSRNSKFGGKGTSTMARGPSSFADASPVTRQGPPASGSRQGGPSGGAVATKVLQARRGSSVLPLESSLID